MNWDHLYLNPILPLISYWAMASYFIPMHLNLFIGKMGIILCPLSRHGRWNNGHQGGPHAYPYTYEDVILHNKRGFSFQIELSLLINWSTDLKIGNFFNGPNVIIRVFQHGGGRQRNKVREMWLQKHSQREASGWPWRWRKGPGVEECVPGPWKLKAAKEWILL